MAKAKVAVLKVSPKTVLKDTVRLCELAGIDKVLDKSATTILKDNISWHFPFPGANTTPWQMEASILALQKNGFHDISAVQNKTVVTNAFKGEDLNNYVPLFKKYKIPVLYNFKDEDMKWVEYRPKAKMHVLPMIFPEGIHIPDYFFGKNILHLPTVKCVAGDTHVVLGDGTRTTIREVVESELSSGRQVMVDADGASHVAGRVPVMAMSDDGSIRAFDAVVFSRSKRGDRRVVRMRTRSGRTITATSDHRIHTPDGWKKLGDISVGSRVALARRLAIAGRPQELPKTSRVELASHTARPGRKYDLATTQRVLDAYAGGQTTTANAGEMGVRWQSVQAILRRHEVPMRGNSVQIKTPSATSPDFWRWLGYLTAEGCIERGESTDKLWWVNSDPGIRAEFVALTKQLFDVDARAHANGKHVYVYGKTLGAFIESLGLPVPLNAGNKIVPPALFRSTNEEIAAFLSAYLDGDGAVSAREAELTAVSKSEGLARDVQDLFARLGIVADVRAVESTIPGKWTEPRTYFQVAVTGAQLSIAAEVLTLRHPRKRERLAQHAERLATSKQPSNWDVVPVPPATFRAVRQGLGLTQAATGKASSVNNIENAHTTPTPRIVRHFVDTFVLADTEARFSAEIGQLRALASEDLAWDLVAEIEEVSGEVDLYDITVPGADSFVANGIVVHNCHIYTTTTGAMKNAFGGLLNTKRHYTHSWIHRTLVDLLAIQKEIHSGLFALMDGTTAGNGPGPRTMFPVIKDYMLASDDQVAIDAVAAKMMGFDPLTLEYIRVAHDDKLGVGDPRDIEIVGDDPATVQKESWGFSVGDNGASMVGDLIWFGPLKNFQKLLMHTPLVNAFIFGSEAYHDYYRWPLKDKKTFETWKRDTHWGRLFEAYERGEAEKVLEAVATT